MGWIAQMVEEARTNAGMEAAQSDHILLTDGSSSIPAVHRLFEQRVGTSRIASGGDLTSLAHGLALIGQAPDIESWSPPEEEQP